VAFLHLQVRAYVQRTSRIEGRAVLKLNAVFLAALLAGAFAPAGAVDVVTGNVPQIDDNLIRNGCGLPDGTASGSPVQGCLNSNHGQLVDLSADESLEITGGQASLDSTDGTFSQLTIALVGNTLGTVILNIDATENGFVTFADGSGIDGTFALDGNGQNFFTATNLSGGFLSFTSFNSQMAEADIVADVDQIRLGVVGVIPEPETYALMLAGLGALGFLARRGKEQR
jgi:hypothetical protein